MIETTLEKWEAIIQGKGGDEKNALLDDLLADDVVFLSPVVFTPQKGKAVTKLYLGAAGATFGGDDDTGKKASEPSGDTNKQDGFRYIKKIVSGNHATLEFETTMGGKYVNGVDIITCNDEGKITEFKVMIRPLQAVNAVHAAMGAMLKKMQDRPEAAA
jgi:hypothetical protein